MTSTDLVPTSAADLSHHAAVAAALGRCEEIRASIASASLEQLIEVRGWAKGLNAVAQAREARDLAYSACLTQVHAERRLGLVLLSLNAATATDEEIEERARIDRCLGLSERWSILRLASVPNGLFQEILASCKDDRPKSISAKWIYNVAREWSLAKVEPGIEQAFDGSCCVTLGKSGKRQSWWRPNLAAARDLLAEKTGMSTKPRLAKSERLDDLLSTARKLSQSVSLTRESLTGEPHRLAIAAEFKLMEACDLLRQAHNAQSIDEIAEAA